MSTLLVREIGYLKSSSHHPPYHILLQTVRHMMQHYTAQCNLFGTYSAQGNTFSNLHARNATRPLRKRRKHSAKLCCNYHHRIRRVRSKHAHSMNSSAVIMRQRNSKIISALSVRRKQLQDQQGGLVNTQRSCALYYHVGDRMIPEMIWRLHILRKAYLVVYITI